MFRVDVVLTEPQIWLDYKIISDAQDLEIYASSIISFMADVPYKSVYVDNLIGEFVRGNYNDVVVSYTFASGNIWKFTFKFEYISPLFDATIHLRSIRKALTGVY